MGEVWGVNLPERKIQRKSTFDYSQSGWYFITIVTYDRKRYFGSLVKGRFVYSQIGIYAEKAWLEIPEHYPFVELGEFILMPDHLHGLIRIDGSRLGKRSSEPGTFGPQSRNLSAIVRAYKSSVKRYANLNAIDFKWQGRFWDVIIRSKDHLDRVSQYIRKNRDPK